MTAEIATRIQVLVLTDSKETAQFLPSLLDEEPGLQLYVSQMAYGAGLKAVAQHRPQVVVVADPLQEPAGAIEELDAAAPNVPILAILPEEDSRGVQACSLAGARTTLLRPFERESLVKAIEQVYLRERQRQRLASASLESGAGQARRDGVAAGPRPPRPRIIAVHGAKGGVGTTTLACNLAASLRRLTGGRVAVIDGDVLSGDVGVVCGLTPRRSLADLLPVVGDLDADLVNDLLAAHATGVRALLAPEALSRAEAVRGEDVQRVLAGLKPYFDYLVVDTPSPVAPVVVAAMDAADLIVLVVTPDHVALRAAARFLLLTSQLGYPEGKVRLVVNRADTSAEVTPAVVAEQLQQSVAAALPSDGRALVECLNVGDLLVAAHPRHRVAAGIAQLARDVAVSFGWEPGRQARVAATAKAPAAAVAGRRTEDEGRRTKDEGRGTGDEGADRGSGLSAGVLDERPGLVDAVRAAAAGASRRGARWLPLAWRLPRRAGQSATTWLLSVLGRGFLRIGATLAATQAVPAERE